MFSIKSPSLRRFVWVVAASSLLIALLLSLSPKPSPDEATHLLFNAVVTGDVKGVALRLCQGANPNARYHIFTPKKTFLPNWIAELTHGDTMLQVDIEAKQSDSYPGAVNDGDSPLILAVRDNNPAIVKLLLNNGANANQAVASHLTPLGVALSDDNVNLCTLLCQRGADVRAMTYTGITALSWAREYKTKCSPVLLQYDKNSSSQPLVNHGSR